VNEAVKSIEIVAWVFNNENSEVLDVKDAFVDYKDSASVKEMPAGLPRRLHQVSPCRRGGEGELQECGYGCWRDLQPQKNMTVIVFRECEDIKHPLNGRSLGCDTVNRGDGHVEVIQQ